MEEFLCHGKTERDSPGVKQIPKPELTKHLRTLGFCIALNYRFEAQGILRFFSAASFYKSELQIFFT
ncbi:MAG: hypothetical protein RSD19_05360, partial [Oscillospiraceae bacterium]